MREFGEGVVMRGIWAHRGKNTALCACDEDAGFK